MKLTLALVIICTLVFLYEVFSPTPAEKIFDEFGFSGRNLLSRPWILITSIFLHADLSHFLSNMAILFLFGYAVEKQLGLRMLLIFFLGAIVGDLLSLLFYGFETISIGASGGIFALIGIGMIVSPFLPGLPIIPLGLIGLVYAIYAAIDFVTMPTQQISYAAHFGGLIIGMLSGFRHEGWHRGIKILLVMFIVLLLIPYVWMTLTHI